MTANNTSQSNERIVNFATVPLYQLLDGASNIDILDQLDARLTQLCAMLAMTHGNGFETFQAWSDEIRNSYMWGCSMSAEECKSLASQLKITR